MYYETDSGQASIGPYSSGGNTYLSLYTNASGNAATEKLRITSDGKVYVNTTSATATFAVKNINDSTLNAVEIYNDNGDVASGFSQSSTGDGNVFAKHADETLNVIFRSNGVSYLKGGDFGVGNDSPSCRLSIKDTAEHTAFNSAAPSVTDCMLQLWNQVPNETANDHATIQFGINGGTHNRVNSISAVAESASSRHTAFVWCTDEGSGRTEKMRLTSLGNLLINKAPGDAGTGASTGIELYGGSYSMFVRGSNIPMYVGRNTTTGIIVSYLYNGTSRGTITTDGTVISLTGTSDYRLKENEVSISDGITRLKQLKPYKFNFKETPSKTQDGFFAHEVQSIVPEAVFGTKDAVYSSDDNENNIKAGDIDAQQLDQSKIIPLLTAALQEAIAKIENLEAEVASLKSQINN
tara:strand:- start:9 stop:1235 length:1227 start_codon:yes stop_codon:yes gene_type:complete